MGPEATAEFYELLIRLSQREYGASQNDAFPEVVIYSVPVPDFIEDLQCKEVAKDMLVSRIKALSSLPISFFCIVCNTAHLLLDDFKKVTEVPFVSIIEETVDEVERLGVNRVGLLASPTTIKSAIYQKALENRGVDVVLPKENEVSKLGSIIKDTVAGKRKEESTHILMSIVEDLVSRGAEVLVLGCTELSLLFSEKFKVPYLDTLEILVGACLRKYYS